jgi:hypothetical protein
MCAFPTALRLPSVTTANSGGLHLRDCHRERRLDDLLPAVIDGRW